MKLSLPAILAAAGLVGAAIGAGARIVLPSSEVRSLASSTNFEKDQSAPEANGHHSPEAATHEEKQGIKSGSRSNEKRNHKDDGVSYFKFSRQFVAPVIRDGFPAAMIVLDVVLELSAESAESLYAIEPKLRDAVLRVLLTQSGNGELQGMLTDPSLLEATREAVLVSVREVIGENVRAVLLMDIAYQPF